MSGHSLARLAGQANQWDFVCDPNVWRSAEIRQKWEDLLAQDEDIHNPYRSIEWFEHWHASSPPGDAVLGLCRDNSGRPVGLAPLRVDRHRLPFAAAGSTFCEFALPGITLARGGPLLSPHGLDYDSFFEALFAHFPHCQVVMIDRVREEGNLWQYLNGSGPVRQIVLPYRNRSVRFIHTLPLPGSFGEYLGKYSAKKRYNLKREGRRLREFGNGNLVFLRIDRGDQAHQYAAEAAALARCAGRNGRYCAWAWDAPETARISAALAERGLLRSYLLYCRGECIACIEGTQIGRTYNLDSSLYHQRYARFSPGTALLQLVVEDLITYRPAAVINFGYGSPCYSHSTTNIRVPYGSFTLFRRRLKNRALRSLHSTFQSAVGLARGIRSVLRRRVGTIG
jgi:CelD/BcsL family acetyltransferase involved in cellulose biosynthesis